MNLLHLNARESRAPETEVLPDGRKRLTRYFENEGDKAKIPPELNLAYGTLDTSQGPTGWTGFRLTNKKLTDELAPKGKDSRPIVLLIFEQIDQSAETAVGGTPQSFTEDGRGVIIFDYIQFSSASVTPGTIGASTAPGHSDYYLKTEDVTDDGTLRTIKRTYVNAGIIATDLQTKNNGALLIQTITSVKTVPTTPGGYTLIGQPTQFSNGLPVYTYTYAKGNGEVSRDVRYTQSSDQGATAGATVTTIRYFTSSSVTSDPTTAPAGTVNVGVTKEDVDGYRIWTSIYAKGVGIVVNDVQTKNGGKLVLYHLVALGGAPSTPSPTIGGTVVSTGAGSRKDSGYDIYDYTWAEGLGEISRGSEYRLSNDGGTTGMTVTTVRYLSASSVSSNPITPPSGFATVQDNHEDVDGYRVWTGIYSNGTGTVIDEKEIKNNGKQVVYNRTAINSAPSTPTPTIGGTVRLIKSGTREDRFHEGVIIYDYMWVEGTGTFKQSIRTRNDGLREQTFVSLGTRVAPSSGNVIVDESEDVDGVTIYTVTAMQSASGGDPTSMSPFTFERYVPFTYPGRLKAYTQTVNTRDLLDVFKSPPEPTEVLATVEVSYQTSGSLGSLTHTRWQPLDGATIYAAWVGLGNNPSNMTESWRDYRSVSATPVTVTGGTVGGGPSASIFGRVVFGGTVATVTVSGGPPDPGGSTWTLEAHLDLAFIDTAGTMYFRKTVVYAAIAAQTALPV